MIVTEWEQFRALDLERVQGLDGLPGDRRSRNIYRPEDMKKHGFAYTCVGRAPTQQPVNLYVPAARARPASTARTAEPAR